MVRRLFKGLSIPFFDLKTKLFHFNAGIHSMDPGKPLKTGILCCALSAVGRRVFPEKTQISVPRPPCKPGLPFGFLLGSAR
jgi:hypothetical protein